jgi:hypothetical protein
VNEKIYPHHPHQPSPFVLDDLDSLNYLDD